MISTSRHAQTPLGADTCADSGADVCVDVRVDMCMHVSRHACRYVWRHVHRHAYVYVYRHAHGMCVDTCIATNVHDGRIAGPLLIINY